MRLFNFKKKRMLKLKERCIQYALKTSNSVIDNTIIETAKKYFEYIYLDK